MISLRARLTRALLRLRMRFRKPDAPMSERRARLDRMGGAIAAADGVRIVPDEVDGRYAEWLIPEGAAEDETVLYLHGGAYTAGSCASHRNAVSHIARAAGIRLLMPEYRLAPEHPFPAALEDGLAAYRWLLQRGADPRKVILAGDSAGGGLALALMVAARDEGTPLPGAAALISAWTDLAATGGSLKSRNDKDPWFDADEIAPMARNYHQDTAPRHPLVSPLYASLEGLPPLMLQVGDHEVLLNDSTRLAEKAREAGVDVTLRVWQGMWHVWHFFVGRMPEAKQAVLEMAAFMEARMAAGRRRCGDG